MKEFPKRKSLRYEDYDYTQPGGYFITIYTQNWLKLFGRVINEEMILNKNGKILDETWKGLTQHYT
ncbi:MAG TPA: hypothetical protein VMW28_01660 [Pelolinea sp.]|nr:hypothetical protein [Pelolinea sp.]